MIVRLEPTQTTLVLSHVPLVLREAQQVQRHRLLALFAPLDPLRQIAAPLHALNVPPDLIAHKEHRPVYLVQLERFRAYRILLAAPSVLPEHSLLQLGQKYALIALRDILLRLLDRVHALHANREVTPAPQLHRLAPHVQPVLSKAIRLQQAV